MRRRIAGVKVIPMKDAGMVELSFAIGFLISFFLTIIFVAIINAISSMRKEEARMPWMRLKGAPLR